MGVVIDLGSRRAERDRRGTRLAPTFFFDVSDPMSYLTAERVERHLGEVDWVAVDGRALGERPEADELRALAEIRARQLRLPLVWPDTFPQSTPHALRAAAYACELGAGARFALAATRLAFCGGFDLEDPEAITEAAAAAGIPLEGCLEAAGEQWRDDELMEMADVLRAHDIHELPAITVAGRWFSGDSALAGAGATRISPRQGGRLRAQSRGGRRPLAPVG